jgi:2-hydroxychromene-2-carboxylate isomerase
MKKRRPRYPWKVVFITAEGALPEEKFSSEDKAYLAVNLKRELIREGLSAVEQATVYEWNAGMARWMTFEKHDLKKEASEFPPNEKLRAIALDMPELVELPEKPKGTS